jgi:hypothetical protein
MSHYGFKEQKHNMFAAYPGHAGNYTHNIGIPEGCEDYKVLMQIRNPYSRIVSMWNLECVIENGSEYKIIKNFDEFATNRIFVEYTQALGIKIPNYLVRYENFIEDVTNLPFVDTKDPVVKNIFNDCIFTNSHQSGISRHKNWKSYYNQYLADIVHENNKKQFEAFNYSKDSWK